MKSSKTVMLAAALGFQARSILRTSFFSELKRSGVRIVILIPNPNESYIVEEFQDENVVVERLEKEKCETFFAQSRLQRWLHKLRIYTGPQSQDLGTHDGRLALFAKHYLTSSKIPSWLFLGFVRMLRRSALLRRGLVALESTLFTPGFHTALFEKYKPQLLVTTSTGGNWYGDAYLIREAKNFGVRTVCLVHSWDNPSSYGLEAVQADYYVAWTEMMKKELEEYHGIPESRIFVGGIPVFEIYHATNKAMSKDEFFEKYGLDSNRRLIVYGTISPKGWYPYDMLVVEFLARAIARGKFSAPCQLIVRLHPRYVSNGSTDMKTYNSLKDQYGHLYFSIPDILSERLPLDMPASELAEVAALVRHADVLVNVWSTLNLEAALCDTPVINIAFDPAPDMNRKRVAFIEQRPDYMMSRPHLKRIIRTQGIRLAHSWTELKDAIDLYLENPQLDQKGRKRIVSQECGYLDTLCSRRISHHLLEIMNSSNGTWSTPDVPTRSARTPSLRKLFGDTLKNS